MAVATAAAVAALAAKYGPTIAKAFSGGTAHGPGTASRARHEGAFAARIRGYSLEKAQDWLSHFLQVTRNCGGASDPASCMRQAQIAAAIIQEKQAAPPVTVAAPAPVASIPVSPVDMPALVAPAVQTPSVPTALSFLAPEGEGEPATANGGAAARAALYSRLFTPASRAARYRRLMA